MVARVTSPRRFDMKRSLASLIALVPLAGCSFFGIRTAKEPEYTVVLSDGEFEIRDYPELVVARTVVEADYDESGSVAFRRLGGYIFGDNRKEQDIEMTAPVLREPEGEEIAMTAPVLQEGSGKRWVMAFVMPAEHRLDSLPVPDDPNVELDVVPPRRVAAVRYSGTTSEEKIGHHAARLSSWLVSRGYEADSSPRSARYDPPWTLPFLRRNEVHIDVRKSPRPE
jgi:hypothetical protein